jgi:triacylglycerol esterase/lipase EstA (alpha/beta hydrolase family)
LSHKPFDFCYVLRKRRKKTGHSFARIIPNFPVNETDGKNLKKNGFPVLNLNYPSRKKPIEALSEWIRDKLEVELAESPDAQWDFVTHSMGGIILRQIMKTRPLPNLGRVIMLGPPNQGSEVVDRLRHFKIIKQINGPACLQLGTEKKRIY